MSLDAIKAVIDLIEMGGVVGQENIVKCLRSAIEQAERQEPYGYFRYDMRLDAWVQSRDSDKGVPFYAAPSQRQPLTEGEIELLALKHAPPIHPDFTEDDDFIEFARAIERAHGIGGGE